VNFRTVQPSLVERRTDSGFYRFHERLRLVDALCGVKTKFGPKLLHCEKSSFQGDKTVFVKHRPIDEAKVRRDRTDHRQDKTLPRSADDLDRKTRVGPRFTAVYTRNGRPSIMREKLLCGTYRTRAQRPYG
jgi:hypothetical protein